MQYSGPEVAKYLQKAIILRGGLTPFGEPRYRLVWAPKRFEQAGGVWHDWDENLGVNERNYFDKAGNELNKPLRVVEELRWIPKYPPKDKWFLEKWCKPLEYGTPATWFSPTSEGGTCYYSWELGRTVPLLGDYPWYGDYEDTGYEFPPSALTEGIILHAIGRIERRNDTLPSSLQGKAIRAEYDMRKRDELREEQWTSNAEAMVGETGWAFNGASFSSGAGEKHKSDREATADKLGINFQKQ